MEALSLYRSPKNIVTLATDQVIKLIVNNHYYTVMFLRPEEVGQAHVNS